MADTIKTVRSRDDERLSLVVRQRDGKLHSWDGEPAVFAYVTATGMPSSRAWYRNGDLHRDDDLPAVIEYDAEGQVTGEQWLRDGNAWREGGKPVETLRGVPVPLPAKPRSRWVSNAPVLPWRRRAEMRKETMGDRR